MTAVDPRDVLAYVADLAETVTGQRPDGGTLVPCPSTRPRVVGIDPSMTATGIAEVTADYATVYVANSKPTTNPTFADRDRRMQDITQRVLRTVDVLGRVDLVVIEGPALGKASPHTWDRAGLWWRIVNGLHNAGVPLAVCPPTVRAKWATGKGTAGKAAVVAAIARMWPDVELIDDNGADALVLATMAAQRVELPMPVRTLARHRDALNGVQWPTRGELNRG